jgi:hypothetical protein
MKVATFMNFDHDLIQLAQWLLYLIPISSWVKGHFSGPDKDFKYDLNHQAYALATHFQCSQPQRFTSLCSPLAPPDYKI